jgi:thiol-disulfide isomerase/thioredoxin
MIKLNGFFALLLGLTLASCNAPPLEQNRSPQGEAYAIQIYSAPWCKPCKELLRDLNAFSLADSQPSPFQFTLYVTTGIKANKPPTPEIAEEYRKELNLSFPAVADRTKYLSTYGEDSTMVPGLAVLSTTGEKLRVFPLGGFTADEVKLYLNSLRH